MKSISYYFDAVNIRLQQNFAKLRDYQFNRKYLIFESDDWGAIRVPSKKIHDYLINLGYDLDSRPYECLDGLECNQDVENLKDLLMRFKDKKGKHPVFTLNYLSANPDFDKINNSKYNSYYWEPIDITYQKYENAENVINLIKEGIAKGVFEIEFHGREHFNIPKWLLALQRGNVDVLTAFNNRMCGIFPKNNPQEGNKYMIALEAENSYIEKFIQEGILEFKRIWGCNPRSFIAPCYTWDRAVEQILSKAGINIIQSSRFQRLPLQNKRKICFTGKKNLFNQVYTVRNCSFEPALTAKDIDPVAKTMNEIRYAFKHNTSAIISTHRINYTSRISKENAERNRQLLLELLTNILYEFPETEFCTGTNLFKL